MPYEAVTEEQSFLNCWTILGPPKLNPNRHQNVFKSEPNRLQISQIDPQEAPGTYRNPQERSGTRQEGEGVCYPDSPSLNVALREVGFTFLGFFMGIP